MVVGLKVTLIVQLAPGFTGVPQLFVWLNGLVAATLVMFKIPRPVFVSVTVLALLLVKTTWSGKVRLTNSHGRPHWKW